MAARTPTRLLSKLSPSTTLCHPIPSSTSLHLATSSRTHPKPANFHRSFSSTITSPLFSGRSFETSTPSVGEKGTLDFRMPWDIKDHETEAEEGSQTPKAKEQSQTPKAKEGNKKRDDDPPFPMTIYPYDPYGPYYGDGGACLGSKERANPVEDDAGTETDEGVDTDTSGTDAGIGSDWSGGCVDGSAGSGAECGVDYSGDGGSFEDEDDDDDDDNDDVMMTSAMMVVMAAVWAKNI
ncbi:hypothetical protein MMC28_002141 [Mycoblastus sanguinarius]|nr:hypothetical protein [Mycoblastus sanguinarius]